MKKIYLIIFILSFGINTNVTAQNSDLNSENTGKICFIRSTGFMGSASAFKTFIDENFVCKLNNKRYSIHEVSAGKHTCSVQFGGKKSKARSEKFEVVVKPNETTYVQIVFETGVLVNNIYCEEVTKNTALNKIKTLKEDKKCL